METYQEAIHQLKMIDLTRYPHDEIVNLIGKLGRFGVLKMMLHPGMVILRGRPEANSYQYRHELSYKPEKYNNTYQRASTPFKTMFYGTIISDEDIRDKPSFFQRWVTAMEASPLIRDDRDGIEPLTYSRWVVTKDIPLLAICYHKDFTDTSPYTKKLRDDFVKMSLEESPVIHKKTIEVTNFLAEMFAKKIKSDAPDYEYMVSAIFTEVSLERAVDPIGGIYYPSVRAKGHGYVVAIAPEYVDSSLRLVAAGECTVYKKGKNITVDNETACEIENNNKPFKMLPVLPAHTIGKEKIMNELGL
jgi:hypothetical protein